MPLRLEIKRKLSARSERVKSVDFHPDEPWVLAALYSGHLFIWNYQTQTLVKSVEVCALPVRCAKFIPQQQWIVASADDMKIRVYNYNTMERLKEFDAHTDYIRSLCVHPTLPYLLSSSDDMFIKLWDWDKGWENTMTFEGHSHYVMQVEFNPKDSNTFASASLDRTLKFWGLNSPTAHFTLEGHERGVNCVSYYRGGDRPYILSGADDQTVKVWDYQTKACVSTLEGHTNNVSAVAFHPHLPIILSGSEDGTVKVWHSSTYRLENTLNYSMDRVWSIACLKSSNKVAFGYDEGTVMVKIGHEEPVVSMERNGKIVWANNHDVLTANVKAAAIDAGEGERVTMASKEMGTCDIYPQFLEHAPNGRHFVACGDGEYIIYTAIALKNKTFGSALDFVWGMESGTYATRESPAKLKVFKNFAEYKAVRPTFAVEQIFGGNLLACRSNDFVDFYDWDMRIIRRIDVSPRKVFWSETGEVVVLCCESSFYVLRYNRDVVAKFLDQGVEVGEQGIDNAFELEQEIQEKVRTAYFVGDCFVYTNAAGKLNYFVGGEVMTLAHLSKTLYLIGYNKENRLFLMDKQCHVYSYPLLLSVLVYQTAIVRRDMDQAAEALPSIPKSELNRVARFLEAQQLPELALEISTDPEHRFELAMLCNKLHLARDIVLESESEAKWRALGDAALNRELDLVLAEECLTKAKDLSGLLLLYTSMGDAQGMERLAAMAIEEGRLNIAFICLFLLHRVGEAVEVLMRSERLPEAAFLARTYLPSRMGEVVSAWKESLSVVKPRAAEALANPLDHTALFPDLDHALAVEQQLISMGEYAGVESLLPAAAYEHVKDYFNRDLILELKEKQLTTLHSLFGGVVSADHDHDYDHDHAEEPVAQPEHALHEQPAEERQEHQGEHQGHVADTQQQDDGRPLPLPLPQEAVDGEAEVKVEPEEEEEAEEVEQEGDQEAEQGADEEVEQDDA